MSETDSFIEEVSEEVRRDRLYSTFRKYAWIPILLVVGIVGGAVANEFFKSRERAAAEATGDAIFAALEAGSVDEQVAALAGIEAKNPDQAVILKMTEAAVLVNEDQADAAYDALRAAAEVAGAGSAYTDLAGLKAAMIKPNDDWSQDVLTRLGQPGQPYRLLALEQLGLAKIETGDIDGGLADFTAVLEDPGVTPQMAQRLSTVVTALGGELPTFGQLVGGDGL